MRSTELSSLGPVIVTMLATLSLLAAGAGAQLALCSTPDALSAAIASGTPHIVLSEHMDLTVLPPQRAADGSHKIFRVPATVESITARPTFRHTVLVSRGAAHRGCTDALCARWRLCDSALAS